jgi:hypothetical protein
MRIFDAWNLGIGQLSWHYSAKELLPFYYGKWDGNDGSVMPKIESAYCALMQPVKSWWVADAG